MAHRVTTRKGSARSQGFALWLLLLSIFTHAMVPSAVSPLQRTSGSAFSASTADVSLAPKRSELAAEDAQLRAEDGSGAAGSGSPDPLIVPAASGAVTPPVFDPLPLVVPLASVPPSMGGAAPFEARAPPTF